MFNVVRFQKLKDDNKIVNAMNHNFRLTHNLPNVNYEKSKNNIYLYGDQNTNLNFMFDYLRENLNFKFDSKRQNKLVECVISASSEFFDTTNKDEQLKFFKDNLIVFKKLFKDCVIVSAVVHNDESTPHMHLIFCPTYKQKKIIKKGKFKDEERQYNCLSYEHYFGNKEGQKNRLSIIQDEWHQQLLKLGYNFKRGLMGTGIKHKKPREKIEELERENKKLKYQNKQLNCQIEQFEKQIQDEIFSDIEDELKNNNKVVKTQQIKKDN